MFSSILVIIAGLLPKISAVLTTIPQAVLGGATISVFATISMTGVKMVSGAGLNPRNIGVVGIALAIGEGIVRVPGSLTGFPQMIIDVFGTSATSTTTLIAVVLNLILPQVIENNSKNASFDDVKRLLLNHGYELDHVKGSHHKFKKGGDTVVIPYHKPIKEIYVLQILAKIRES